MTTESKVQVGVSSDYLDTTEITQSDGQPAHREAVFIADPMVTAARAKVKNPYEYDEYHAMVLDPRTDMLVDIMRNTLKELEVMNLQLSLITGQAFSREDL